MKDCNALMNLLHLLMSYTPIPQALQVQGPKLTICGGGGRASSLCPSRGEIALPTGGRGRAPFPSGITGEGATPPPRLKGKQRFLFCLLTTGDD